jgi:hypothetical protein
MLPMATTSRVGSARPETWKSTVSVIVIVSVCGSVMSTLCPGGMQPRGSRCRLARDARRWSTPSPASGKSESKARDGVVEGEEEASLVRLWRYYDGVGARVAVHEQLSWPKMMSSFC